LLRYALLRVLGAIPTLLLVIVLAFLMVHAAPGGPFQDPRGLPPETLKALQEAYGLDQPLLVQLWRYLSHVVRGDFGPSYHYVGYSVGELIRGTLPVSLLLGTLAILLAVLAGVACGTLAALRRNSALDRLLMGIAMTGISIPVFVVAPVLVLVFAVKLHWLPAGWTGSEGLARLVLPVIALALPQIAYIARLTRAGMIEVLGSDYIRTARAQGLGTAAIVRYHAFRPALVPVLSYLGPAIAAILTGAVVIEEVFGIPGLGELFVRAAGNRDYMVVLGVVVLYAVLVVALNLAVDILYGVIDPRVRRR
jgi:oligopeptide transport system permease protein